MGLRNKKALSAGKRSSSLVSCHFDERSEEKSPVTSPCRAFSGKPAPVIWRVTGLVCQSEGFWTATTAKGAKDAKGWIGGYWWGVGGEGCWCFSPFGVFDGLIWQEVWLVRVKEAEG
jgi:hypothetical protein